MTKIKCISHDADAGSNATCKKSILISLSSAMTFAAILASDQNFKAEKFQPASQPVEAETSLAEQRTARSAPKAAAASRPSRESEQSIRTMIADMIRREFAGFQIYPLRCRSHRSGQLL